MAARLQHFIDAQNQPRDGYEAAMRELRSGCKTGHWIWYVFPQLAGLGSSTMSRRFALASVDEAADYLRNPLLRGRLLEAARAVVEQLEKGREVAALMGSDVDARKLVSSMTLFAHVPGAMPESEGLHERERLAAAAERILTLAAPHGYPPCAWTRRQMGA